MEADAIESALRALRHRDRSAHDLERRLTEQGFPRGVTRSALETLDRVGVIDDERFARSRAESLAARGWGDDLVRHRLREAGVDADLVEEVVTQLEPEVERARRIVGLRGRSARTARYLRARGFSPDVVTSGVATDEGNELG